MFKNSKSNKSETIEHFMVKLLCWKCCLELNHKAYIEYVVEGTGVFDVFDETTGIIYEIEPKMNYKKLREKWAQYKVVCGVNDIVLIPYKRIMTALSGLTFTDDTRRRLVKEIKRYIH